MIYIPGRHVEGGMGSISVAISNAAKEAGAYIVTDAEVSLVFLEFFFSIWSFVLRYLFNFI